MLKRHMENAARQEPRPPGNSVRIAFSDKAWPGNDRYPTHSACIAAFGGKAGRMGKCFICVSALHLLHQRHEAQWRGLKRFSVSGTALAAGFPFVFRNSYRWLAPFRSLSPRHWARGRWGRTWDSRSKKERFFPPGATRKLNCRGCKRSPNHANPGRRPGGRPV